MKTLYRVQLRDDKDKAVKTSLCTNVEDAKAIEERWIRELTIEGYKVSETIRNSHCWYFSNITFLFMGTDLCTVGMDNYLYMENERVVGTIE